jgi:hypothetical protein
MSGSVERKQNLERWLATAWFWGAAFLVLFIALAAMKAPENWLYILGGVGFLLLTVPVALAFLRYGARWLEFGLLAALVIQAWSSQELFPPVSAIDFGLQLCISAGGMYFFIYALRRPLIIWLERSGAI